MLSSLEYGAKFGQLKAAQVTASQRRTWLGQLRAAQAMASQRRGSLAAGPVAGAAIAAARRLSVAHRAAIDERSAVAPVHATPGRTGRRRASLRCRGDKWDVAAEVVEASKFVGKFRDSAARMKNNRLLQRREALTVPKLRFAMRRPAISSQSGMLAHLNAIDQETATLALVRELIASGTQRVSVSETLGFEAEEGQGRFKSRRHSFPIDWEDIRLRIQAVSAQM